MPPCCPGAGAGLAAWLPNPVVLAIAVLLCLLFRQGLRHARAGPYPLEGRLGRRPLLFLLGVLTFVLAFALPTASILAQMVEHVLLAFAVPPLLLLGVPRPLLLPLFEHRRSRHALRAVTRPARAAALFMAALFLWYLPRLFDAALASDWLRLLAGLSILVASLLFWWPVIEPFPAWEPELADLGKLLYLFVASSALKVLGFILALVPRPIYAPPAGAPALWGLSRLDDQHYAGWLLVMAGTFVLLGAATVVCARLFADPDDAADDADGGAGRWGPGAREYPGAGGRGPGTEG